MAYSPVWETAGPFGAGACALRSFCRDAGPRSAQFAPPMPRPFAYHVRRRAQDSGREMDTWRTPRAVERVGRVIERGRDK